MEGKPEEAQAAVARLVSTHPASAEALSLQAELQLVAGNRAGARASLQQAIAAEPSAAYARFELISLLIGDREFDAAAQQIKEARARRGGDLRLTYFEALLAVGRNEYGKARELTQQILKGASSMCHPWCWRAVSNCRRNTMRPPSRCCSGPSTRAAAQRRTHAARAAISPRVSRRAPST